jgi:hypothetical protein
MGVLEVSVSFEHGYRYVGGGKFPTGKFIHLIPYDVKRVGFTYYFQEKMPFILSFYRAAAPKMLLSTTPKVKA